MPFSAKTLDFLFENRLHDSKEWFEEHKEQYQELVLKPLQELAKELAPVMLTIDDQFTTEPRVDKTICRIRRDTRFSKDKSIYRDVMWLIYKRGKMHGAELPGFYFEINQQGFSYGCGYYAASVDFCNTMRKLILSADETFQKAQKAFEGQTVFRMDGDCYKRPRFSDQPPELQLWLERRGISFNADSKDFETLFSRGLCEKLNGEFPLLKPVYEFLFKVAMLTSAEQAEKKNGFPGEVCGSSLSFPHL